MESFKELNRICQKPRYKEVGNWLVRRFVRDAALPITWLLLHTGVTANQVTSASFAFALAGAAFVASRSVGAFLIGAFLLQIWYLLDHVDGQIARYRGTASLTGRFYDFLTHHVIHGAIFFSLGYYAFQATNRQFFVIWAFVMSLSVIAFNLIHDTKCKAFYERLIGSQAFRVRHQQREVNRQKEGAILGWGFSFLHKLCEIHVVMNLLTLSALAEAVMRFQPDTRLFWAVVYGFVTPLITVIKISHWIKGRKIDHEFDAVFHPVDLPE